MKAIEEAGYTTPTPIQQQAVPEALAGHDLMASAQTGTGKTAAFTIPALQRLAEPSTMRGNGPRILVLTPTRELAAQVSDAARKYGKFLRIRSGAIVGGMGYPQQNRLLSQPLDLLVATPGRLIDHMERGRIDFSRLEMLILDEADRMLDMGFLPDVERIAAATPSTRQTLLFSATLEGNIGKLAQKLLRTPKTIQISAQHTSHANIEQRMHYVDDLSHKNRLLQHLLSGQDVNQAIVFTSTKRHADQLADDLGAIGHKVAALHGDMKQSARNRTLTKLRHGDVRVLVATDVAARGIDISGISHVINFDMPKFAEDYVHRIGRTGRAGNTGTAISLVSGSDRPVLGHIERFTGKRLEAHIIPGFEPTRRSQQPSSPRSFDKRPSTGGYAGRGRPDAARGRPDDSRGRPDAGRGRPDAARGRPAGNGAPSKTFKRTGGNFI